MLPLADRFLERALLFTMVSHLLAMGTMALFLLPGIPGGTTAELAERAAYIANHLWLWRIGWFPWQVTAVSDLVLGIAMLRSCSMPKLPARLAFFATAVAVMIEQPNEFRWITVGVDYARQAVENGVYDEYLQFIFMMIWFVLVTEQVLRRSRPDDAHGRYAPWKSRYRWPFGPMIDLVANARLPRAFGELLPSLSFVSDSTAFLKTAPCHHNLGIVESRARRSAWIFRFSPVSRWSEP